MGTGRAQGPVVVVDLSVWYMLCIQNMDVLFTRWLIGATMCWDQIPSLSLFIPQSVLIDKVLLVVCGLVVMIVFIRVIWAVGNSFDVSC